MTLGLVFGALSGFTLFAVEIHKSQLIQTRDSKNYLCSETFCCVRWGATHFNFMQNLKTKQNIPLKVLVEHKHSRNCCTVSNYVVHIITLQKASLPLELDRKRITVFIGRPLVHPGPTLVQSQRNGAEACAPPCFGHVTSAYEDGGSFFFLEVKPRLKPKHPADRGLGVHCGVTSSISQLPS